MSVENVSVRKETIHQRNIPGHFVNMIISCVINPMVNYVQEMVNVFEENVSVRVPGQKKGASVIMTQILV